MCSTNPAEIHVGCIIELCPKNSNDLQTDALRILQVKSISSSQLGYTFNLGNRITSTSPYMLLYQKGTGDASWTFKYGMTSIPIIGYKMLEHGTRIKL